MGKLVFGMMQSLDGYVAGGAGLDRMATSLASRAGWNCRRPVFRSVVISTITSAAWPAVCAVVVCTK